MSEYAIEISGLRKSFGSFEAVKGVDLKIRRGEIFGLLGPNGAGKTTILNMVLGLLKSTKGSIIIEGMNIDKHANEVKRRMGFMTQETVVDGSLSARDNLMIAAELYHVPREVVGRKVEEALKEADLTSFADSLAGTYSGGMQRRLNLVKSMIQEPKILILDEPTTGLDVQSRFSMWGHIRRLNKEGMTIILTTQYLEEADALCNRIAIIDHGSIKAQGTASELKRMVFAGNLLEIVTKPEDTGKAEKLLFGRLGIKATVRDDRLSAVLESRPLATMIKAAQMLETEKVEVLSISLHLPTMDDVFLKLTGESFRDSTGEQTSAMTKLRSMRGR